MSQIPIISHWLVDYCNRGAWRNPFYQKDITEALGSSWDLRTLGPFLGPLGTWKNGVIKDGNKGNPMEVAGRIIYQ
jgi:hypothetical protein